MRRDWNSVTIGDVADITDYVANGSFATLRDNVTYKSTKDYAVLVRLADFSNDFDETRFVYIDKHSYDFLAKSKLYGGEIIMSNVGSIGKLFICPDLDMPMSLGPNCIVIKTAYNPFFYYLLSSRHYQNLIQSISSTTALPKFNKTTFRKLPVSFPSLSEQERIVAELDLIQGIIDKQKAQLKELDTLAQAIFYDMFGDPVENEKGWPTIALKDAVLEMFLGPFGSALKTECYVSKEDSFCMVYEQKHAIRKTMNVETHYIGKEKFESLKRFEVHSGDFIMSCRGTIGEIYRLPEDAPIGIIHPSLMKIRIKEDVYNPTFFLWLLSRIIRNESTNGNCVQMAITAKELGTRTPIFPPIDIQQAFATQIDAIERQKASINASIAETQKLFDYTMDKYFG